MLRQETVWLGVSGRCCAAEWKPKLHDYLHRPNDNMHFVPMMCQMVLYWMKCLRAHRNLDRHSPTWGICGNDVISYQLADQKSRMRSCSEAVFAMIQNTCEDLEGLNIAGKFSTIVWTITRIRLRCILNFQSAKCHSRTGMDQRLAD